MEDETNNRRLLIAAGLCLLVLIAWNVFFPPPKKPQVAMSADAGVATSTSTAEHPQLAATSTRTQEVVQTSSNVKPQLFTFKGEVPADGPEHKEIPFEVHLTNVGGGIDYFELPSYKERDRDNRKTDQPIT